MDIMKKEIPAVVHTSAGVYLDYVVDVSRGI